MRINLSAVGSTPLSIQLNFDEATQKENICDVDISDSNMTMRTNILARLLGAGPGGEELVILVCVIVSRTVLLKVTQ